MLLPILVASFGIGEAIPFLTVPQLIGNGSRVWFNRRELDCRVVAGAARGGSTGARRGAVVDRE